MINPVAEHISHLSKQTLLELDQTTLLDHILNVEDSEYFVKQPGEEHYRLLSYISTGLSDKFIYDIGTYRGHSALALSYTNLNLVVSYDIYHYATNMKRPDNVEYRIGNFVNDINLINSPFILVDITHTGREEQQIFDYLEHIKYQGLVMWDDIHLNTEMETFWTKIKKEKYDLTHIGHWSGTGLVVFG